MIHKICFAKKIVLGTIEEINEKNFKVKVDENIYSNNSQSKKLRVRFVYPKWYSRDSVVNSLGINIGSQFILCLSKANYDPFYSYIIYSAFQIYPVINDEVYLKYKFPIQINPDEKGIDTNLYKHDLDTGLYVPKNEFKDLINEIKLTYKIRQKKLRRHLYCWKKLKEPEDKGSNFIGFGLMLADSLYYKKRQNCD